MKNGRYHEDTNQVVPVTDTLCTALDQGLEELRDGKPDNNVFVHMYFPLPIQCWYVLEESATFHSRNHEDVLQLNNGTHYMNVVLQGVIRADSVSPQAAIDVRANAPLRNPHQL